MHAHAYFKSKNSTNKSLQQAKKRYAPVYWQTIFSIGGTLENCLLTTCSRLWKLASHLPIWLSYYRKTIECHFTSSDELLSLLNELEHHLVVADERLEAEEMKDLRLDIEEGHDAQEDNRNRKVYVETIRDEWYHIHVAHDLHCRGSEDLQIKYYSRHYCISFILNRVDIEADIRHRLGEPSGH